MGKVAFDQVREDSEFPLDLLAIAAFQGAANLLYRFSQFSVLFYET
jgi:hypothetical protein